MPKMIKTRICMISDTHTCTPAPPEDKSTPYRAPLPKADILLHAGDITKVGRKIEHEAMLDMLKEADAELKIVIAGNHDITLDPVFYAEHGARRHYTRRLRRPAATTATAIGTTVANKKDAVLGSDGDFFSEDGLEDPHEIRALYTGADAVKHGIFYLEEETRTFRLSSGAQFTIYASPYQPAFFNWAFSYPREVDRFNPSPAAAAAAAAAAGAGATNAPVLADEHAKPVPDFPHVDIMLTHGPPRGVLDAVYHSGEHVGCDHLFQAVARARPRLHVFGHIHEGHGAARMRWTTPPASESSDAYFPGLPSASLVSIPQDPQTALERRHEYHDASSDTASPLGPLRFGEETLFVNASVVTVRYRSINAPWVVDMDLPAADSIGLQTA